MRAAIIFVGTSKYRDYFPNYYSANQKLFLPDADKTFFAFSDDNENAIFSQVGVIAKRVEHEKWPLVSLKRFEYMNTVTSDLENYDWVFFVDADLHAQALTLTSDIEGDHDYIGVEHPGFYRKPDLGTFERNPASTAFVDYSEAPPFYWQGCFWGVRGSKVKSMVETLTSRINEDLSRDFVAVWFDESHLNRFFLDNINKLKTLHPGFAAPDPRLGYEEIHQNFEAKFHHLLKDNAILHGDKL